VRTPEWKPQEFETLPQHPELNKDAPTEPLPGHRVGAAGVVRWSILAYHEEQKTSMLSEMMLHRPERSALRCPLFQRKL